MFCAVLTWALILYAEFVVINVILLPYAHSSFYSIFNIILYMIVTVLAVSSHVRTMLSDPVSSKCVFIFKKIVCNCGNLSLNRVLCLGAMLPKNTSLKWGLKRVK